MDPDNLKSFSQLLDQGLGEIPKAPEFRKRIRRSLESVGFNRLPSWEDILITWARETRVRAGFIVLFLFLSCTTYLELSRPEPAPENPPIPSFLLDRLLSE